MLAKLDRWILIAVTFMMIICSFLIIGMFLVYKRVKESLWLDPEEESFAYQSCVVCYFVFYILALCLVLIRMIFNKRVCGLMTALFMVCSLVLVIMSGALASQLTKDSWQITKSDAATSTQCVEGALGTIAAINRNYE